MSLRRGTRWLSGALLCWLVCALTSWAHAREPLRIGMLAYRPKPMIEDQWKPMAAYLQKALSQPVQITFYDYDELNTAIEESRLDVVLTNPGHFVLLQHRYSLSAPIATQITQQGDQEVAAFGGTIIARSDARTINSLDDLAGKRIAITGTFSLGGYQMQAFEMLEAGLALPDARQLLVLGMPHDNVARAILAGKADVGFLRSGAMESMARDGTLDLTRLKVINRQNLPAFPFAVSTRLYPEWPVAVLPHVSEHLSRQLTVALLSLDADSVAARSTGIHGFSSTANYAGVDELLRKLRVPPYAVAPEISLFDIWRKYDIWIAANVMLVVLLLCISLWLWRQGRDLRSSERHLLQVRNDLQSTLNAIPDVLLELDLDGTQHLVHATRKDLLVQPPASLIGKKLSESLPAQANATYLAALQEANSTGQSTGRQIELPLGAEKKWFELSIARKVGAVTDEPRFIVLSRDISERKRAETLQQLAASVFNHTQDAIIVTDANCAIIEVNKAFTDITGFTRVEALGQNPRILKSGRHGADHYDAMWQQLAAQGYWVGEMWNRRKDGQEYVCMQSISMVRAADGQPQRYVALLNDITAIKEQQRQLQRVTHFDTLTQLPNRTLLIDRLQQAIAHSQRQLHPLAVAYFDLDGFKAVNDALGHQAGDELLIHVARHVRAALRDGDTLARIGGDEFVMLLVDLDSVQQYEQVLERVLGIVAQPVSIQGAKVQVSASMGVTVYPHDLTDADQLMRHADQAMVIAKLAGKNCYHLFDISQDESQRSQRESVQQVAQALERNEFVLHYQPKVNMTTGTVIGAEALIRWQHPVRGLLAPGVFLPLIEGHSISIALGEWVIASALSQMSAWSTQGLRLPVSVNISGLQLQDPDFTQRLTDLLARHPEVPAQDLELEILETSALEDIAQVSSVMQACRVLGVTFALDDFGTGYSSLTYLRRLPAELLKIDQSFVRDMLDDPADLAIVKGVIGLAAAFHRRVIAEGVETALHGQQLLRLGCELAQGYGISRPLPADQLPRWVATWTPDRDWAM